MLDWSHPWLLSVCLTMTPMCYGGTWWIFASIITPFISSLSGASVCLIRMKLLVTLSDTGQILFLHLFKHLIYLLLKFLISTKTNKSACTTKNHELNGKADIGPYQLARAQNLVLRYRLCSAHCKLQILPCRSHRASCKKPAAHSKAAAPAGIHA